MSDGYGIEIDQYPKTADPVPAPAGERGGVILVTLSVDPTALKKMLPWTMSYTNERGAVTGGIVTLPSGTPVEMTFTAAVLPAASD